MLKGNCTNDAFLRYKKFQKLYLHINFKGLTKVSVSDITNFTFDHGFASSPKYKFLYNKSNLELK